jgi:hypothetical protein
MIVPEGSVGVAAAGREKDFSVHPAKPSKRQTVKNSLSFTDNYTII